MAAPDVVPADAGPAWLRAALAETPEVHEVEVEGAVVRHHVRGRLGATPLVLLHGGLANAAWWDAVAPLLTDRPVVSVDLSGHGRSGARASYDAHQWGREVLAVIRHVGLVRPVVVGHSMGGQVAVAVGVDHPDAVSGVVTVDTRFNDEAYPGRDRPRRHFASLEDGIRAFRPFDPSGGPGPHPVLLRHLAERSLVHEDAGWRWARDDHPRIEHTALRALLPQLTVPLAVVRPEHGLVTAEAAETMRGISGGPVVDVEVPESGHNPMLDQPLALADALRTLLATWPAGAGPR